MSVFIGFDADTGRPFGTVFSSDKTEAAKNWEGCSVLEIKDGPLPDLSDKWVIKGALVDRSVVKDQAALDDMATQEAEAVKVQAGVDLAVTDGPFIRVAEDLITALIKKKVIALTDLPEAAQDKIAARQALRSSL